MILPYLSNIKKTYSLIIYILIFYSMMLHLKEICSLTNLIAFGTFIQLFYGKKNSFAFIRFFINWKSALCIKIITNHVYFISKLNQFSISMYVRSKLITILQYIFLFYVFFLTDFDSFIFFNSFSHNFFQIFFFQIIL